MYVDLNKDLTSEQVALKEQSHQFAANVLRPASVQLDALDPQEVIAPGSVLWDVFRQAYRQGFHLLQFPEEQGGANLGALEMHMVYEETAWGSADFAIALGVCAFPFSYAARMAALTGNKALMDEIVLPFAADREAKYIGCWAVTEPEHGSDTLMVGTEAFNKPETAGQCRARLDGDEWVINGQKSAWVSNGTIASHALLFLTVDPTMGMAGGGVAVVPLDLPGVTKGKPLNKLGQRALNQGEIFFDDVRIPRHYMLVEASAYNANTSPPALPYSIASKITCTQAAFDVASDAVQLFGGLGLCKELLVEKLFRDARASLIEDGANEVLALTGVRQVIDSYTS